MRGVLRWAVREPRVWVALGAFVVAVLLAGSDGRSWWTGWVAGWTLILAALSIRHRYEETHPGKAEARAAKEAAKQQAEVDAILWKYERDRAARGRAKDGR